MKCINAAKIIILMITGIMLSAVFGTAAQASVTWLSSIPVKVIGPEDESAPGRIAIDAKGNIYVTDRRNMKDRVVVFDHNGNYLRTLATVKSPVSVAVDANGNIYVGSAKTGSVDVYTPDFTFVSKLGSGDNEFKFPGSLAVSSDGHVFAVDTAVNAVKVYNSDGTYAFTFGAYGSDSGKFNEPYGIAIDNARGEIYITDRPVITITDPTYGVQYVASARVQVFDMNGVFKRSFGQYGSGAGQMTMPLGIAADGAGNLYITDASLACLHVFDVNGAWAETISVPVLKTPIGVAVGRDGRIFVASSNNGSIEVYGQAGYTTITVSPKTLAFSAVEGAAAPAAQTVDIANTGSGILAWSASNGGASWLVTQASGTAGPAPNGTSSLSIGVATAGLRAGVYTGTVTVTAGSGAQESIAVTLTVSAPPAILSISPASLAIKAQQNGPVPPAQSFKVQNTGSGPMTWQATSASSMLKLDISTPFVMVSLSTTTLNAGTYNNNIVTFTATGDNGSTVQGSPQNLNVSVQIVNAGTVKVSSNLANAAFDITGPAGYAGSGKTWSSDDIVPGDYTITFRHVPGYLKPASQKFSVATGQTVPLNGDYRRKPAPTHILAGSVESAEMKVAILPLDSSKMPRSFAPAFADAGSLRVASGDLDASGSDKIVVTDHSKTVKVFSDQGGEALASYELTGYRDADAVVADIDNDGKADILVGGYSEKSRIIKVLSFVQNANEPQKYQLQEKATLFTEASDKEPAFSMAVGDVNGDGLLEVVLADSTSIRAFAVQQSALTQLWARSGAYGSAPGIAAGDLNNDGIYEIAVSHYAKEAKGGRRAGENASLISILKGSGEDYNLTIEPFKDLGYGKPATIAVGDIDGDGLDEIVAGAGPADGNEPVIRIFESDGAYAGITMKPLNGKNGVNVGLGMLAH